MYSTESRCPPTRAVVSKLVAVVAHNSGSFVACAVRDDSFKHLGCENAKALRGMDTG